QRRVVRRAILAIELFECDAPVLLPAGVAWSVLAGALGSRRQKRALSPPHAPWRCTSLKRHAPPGVTLLVSVRETGNFADAKPFPRAHDEHRHSNRDGRGI